ncbi:Unc-84-like protein A [Operophtera brumata]|uniref:Unc-84-like protein A n=1 Tax=Operophtera brumata TaxID=104452 RepID=A0A0L7LI49_OPEBR|nr:Unc-84-like protein A [Operophtera brumata]
MCEGLRFTDILSKYPKTDYTYSPLSKDRVELAPGQVAMPNMSRRSLAQFRAHGPGVSADELDRLAATSAWTASTLRKRYTSFDSSDDESAYLNNGAPYTEDQRWWITPNYTYENWDHFAVPNFTDFQLNLAEFTNKIPAIPLPNITLADLNILPKINLTMPQINITLPDIRENLPELRTYNEYKDIVQNRMVDASDYMKVVAESCFEEMRRFWRGVI